MKRLLFFLVITFIQANAQTPGAGVTIDGYTYSTVIINGREWMAENLKATKWESGISFQTVTVNQFLTAPMTNNIQLGPYATPAMIEPAWSSANGNGKLYNFPIVYNQNQVIKSGWRIPSKQEWLDMIAYTNAATTDNMRKVEQPTDNFWTCSGNFLNQYGFSAIGVGRVNVNSANTEAVMDFVGEGSFFWSVSNGEDGQTNVSAVNINCNGIGSGQYMTANYTINRRSALSVRLIKDVALSVDDLKKSKVVIYPNPVRDILNIQTDEAISGIEIFDLLGKKVFEENDTKNIDVLGLQKGVYVLKVNIDKGILIKKFIKE